MGEMASVKHHLDVLGGRVTEWMDNMNVSERKVVNELNSLSGAYDGIIQHVRELDNNVPMKADRLKFDALVKDFQLLSDEISPVIRSSKRLQARAWGAAMPHPPSVSRSQALCPKKTQKNVVGSAG